MKNLLKAKSEFRKKGVVLVADKVKQGVGGTWKFASEDNLINTIQKPLTECGLEVVSTIEYRQDLGTDVICTTLYHIDSGESMTSSISMPPVEPRKDKNGNAMYLDAEIERGKQFGYWSRILTIRILGLSDIDPEDVNNRPEDISDTSPINKLKSIVAEAEDSAALEKWITDKYKVTSIDNLSSDQANAIIRAIEAKKNGSAKS